MTTHLFKDVKAKDIVTLSHNNMPDFSLTGKVVFAEHDLNYDYGIMLEGLSTRFYAETGFVIENHEKHVEKPLESIPLRFKYTSGWCVGIYNKTQDNFIGTDIRKAIIIVLEHDEAEDWEYL